MLARSFRLQKKDFDRIYKKGQTARQDLFLLRYLPNRAGHSRFSVVIAKKVVAHAVDRNQIKRKVYQIIFDSAVLWQNKGLDIAFILKKVDAERLESTVKKILQEI
jgi:ribonuclease P protein component